MSEKQTNPMKTSSLLAKVGMILFILGLLSVLGVRFGMDYLIGPEDVASEEAIRAAIDRWMHIAFAGTCVLLVGLITWIVFGIIAWRSKRESGRIQEAIER